jgi:hemolysin III
MDRTNKIMFYEEITNAITHGIGFVLSIIALVFLIKTAVAYGDVRYTVSFSIYGASLIILYLASTLYHSVPKGKLKDAFKIFDHSAIYVLIAGSYTPIALLVLKGKTGLTLLITVWTIALFGIVFKLFFSKRFKIFSTIIYLLMGWLLVFLIKPLIVNLNSTSMLFLIGGGVTYSLGTIFYLWKNLKFNHAIWHLFVLGGSVCHFFSVYFLTLNC